MPPFSISAIEPSPGPKRLIKISSAELLAFAKENAGSYFPTVARNRPFMVDVIEDHIVCYPESKIDVWLTPSVQLKHFNSTNDLRPGSYPRETFSNSYFVGLVSAMIKGTPQLSAKQVPNLASKSLLPSDEFDAEVRRLRKDAKLPAPQGQSSPAKKQVTTTQVCRDPAVKAWVLKTSKGRCGACGDPAPFKDEYGLPFLEVHHVIPLGNGGADKITNAVALCPNCHRALHHAKDRTKRV